MHRDNAYTVSTYIYSLYSIYTGLSLTYVHNLHTYVCIYFVVLIQVLTFYGHCRYDPSRSKRQSIGPSSLPQTIVMPSRQLKDALYNQASNGSAKVASKVSSSGEPVTSSDSLPKPSSGKTHEQSTTLGRMRGAQSAASGTLESKLPQPLSCSLPSKHSEDEVRLCTPCMFMHIHL